MPLVDLTNLQVTSTESMLWSLIWLVANSMEDDEEDVADEEPVKEDSGRLRESKDACQ